MVQFSGSMTALVTPFKDDGKIDFKTYESLVDWQISEGTDALIPCGTTGEASTMTMEEHVKTVETCVKTAKKRVPVIGGAGSNNTEEALYLVKHLEKIGVDAVLVVTPYYNKPSQEGLYQHYKKIHDSCGIPIVLYNVPGRTGVDLAIDTIARLSELPRVLALKEANADLARPLKIRAKSNPKLALLSGEDATIAAFLAQGGHGCISVSANVAPKLCKTLHKAWREKDWKTFEDARDRLGPIHDAMFVETNPSPAKYALSLMGKCREDVRLPLWTLQDSSKKSVRAALEKTGIL